MAASNVLITGATGFVGSHVVDVLAERGHSLRALVRATSDTRRLLAHGVDLVPGGLDDTDALARAVRGIDVVVHLAALTHARSAAEFQRVNEFGTRDLLAAALGTDPGPRRFVYLSSLAAAGPTRGGQPVEPEDEPRPLTQYGRSKLAGELACRSALDQIEAVVLRAPAVYGPGDRELLRFFRTAARGILPVPTGPARPLQLIHVRDLARAVADAVAVPGARGTVHIAHPQVHVWEEVARMVADAVGRQARIVRVPASGIVFGAVLAEAGMRLAGRSSLVNRDKVRELLAPGWLCETERARSTLGFEAKIALREGLAETAQWYRENGWL